MLGTMLLSLPGKSAPALFRDRQSGGPDNRLGLLGGRPEDQLQGQASNPHRGRPQRIRGQQDGIRGKLSLEPKAHGLINYKDTKAKCRHL
jgi:hypothetical protein